MRRRAHWIVWIILCIQGYAATTLAATWLLLALLGLQFALGISNVLLALPMWSRVLHLGTGAAIWVFMVILAVTLNRGENQQIKSTLNSELT